MNLHFLQRWFNIPPVENAPYITDKYGEKFWIYWDVERFNRAAELHVSYRGRPVGVVNSLREHDNSITLADIIVFENRKMRNRGLGKSMMKEFIRWAKENKFRKIIGFIEPHDGSQYEYREEWYKRQGFVVQGSLIFYELDGNV